MYDIRSAHIWCGRGVLAHNLKIGGPLDSMRNTAALASRAPGHATTTQAAA
jgi:hypothetical protein